MSFRLRRRKPVAETVRDLGTSLLKQAADLLQVEPPTAPRIHRARTSIKRLRTLLTLVDPEMGPAPRPLDRQLRDANRALSVRRDADVLQATWRDLARQGPARKSAGFAESEAVLAALAAARPDQEPLALDAVVWQLHRARRAWQKLTIDGNGWPLFAAGLRASYRRGRRQWRRTRQRPDADALHALRKQGKHLQYLLELLEPASPDRLSGERAAVEALTDLLGRHHDLEVLALALDRELPWPSSRARRQVLSVLRKRQATLTRRALRRAESLFAEPPKDYLRRMKRYWTVWRKPVGSQRPPRKTRRLTVKPR